MPAMRIAIPDDYQDIVHRLKCFDLLRGHEVVRFREPARNEDELVERVAKARGLPPMVVTLACTAGQVIAQIGLALQPTAPLVVGALWMVFAFCVAGATAGYITVGQMFPPEQTARVATAVNTLTLGAAFLLQAAVGWTLDLWPRTGSGGWDPRGYSAALGLSVAVQLLVAAQLMRRSA